MNNVSYGNHYHGAPYHIRLPLSWQGVLYVIFFVASGLSFATALELLIRSASTMCYDQEE